MSITDINIMIFLSADCVMFICFRKHFMRLNLCVFNILETCRKLTFTVEGMTMKTNTVINALISITQDDSIMKNAALEIFLCQFTHFGKRHR